MDKSSVPLYECCWPVIIAKDQNLVNEIDRQKLKSIMSECAPHPSLYLNRSLIVYPMSFAMKYIMKVHPGFITYLDMLHDLAKKREKKGGEGALHNQHQESSWL